MRKWKWIKPTLLLLLFLWVFLVVKKYHDHSNFYSLIVCRDFFGKEWDKLKQPRKYTLRISYVYYALLEIKRRQVSVKSQIFFNMSWTMMSTMNKSKWMLKIPLCLNPTQKTVGNWGKLGAEEVSSTGKSISVGCVLSNGQLWKHAYKCYYTASTG